MGFSGLFGSCFGWLIQWFSSKLPDAQHNTAKVDPDREPFQIINSKFITVEMCCERTGGEGYLEEHEIFQPLHPDSGSLPCAEQHEHREHPILDGDARRGVEPMAESVDEVEEEIDHHG